MMDTNAYTTNGQTSLPEGKDVAQSLNPYKLQEGNSWIYAKKTATDKSVQKRPFLKKGTGIARYYGSKLPEPASKTVGSTTELPNSTSTSADSPTLPNEASRNGLSSNCSDKGPKPKEPLTSVGGSMYDNNDLVGQDLCDFRGGNGLRNGHNEEALGDDPYLEMDSSFTESESQLRDDKGTENKNLPNVASSNSSVSLMELWSLQRMQTNSQENIHIGSTEEIDNLEDEDDAELKIFEIMEKVVEQPNMCPDSAIVKDFVNTRLNLSPTPQTSIHSSSDGSTPCALSNSKMNSYSLISLASSASTSSEGPAPGAIPPNVVERVLEQIRGDSEKFSRIVSDSGGQKSSTQLQGALLTARAMELEAEIKKFRKENSNIVKIREQWQERYNQLEDARMQHEQLKDRELRLIEEEKQRIARKKSNLHELLRQYEIKCQELNAPSRSTTTSEVASLNGNIIQLQTDLQRKNAQFGKAQKKLKDEIAALKKENAGLVAEIERLRDVSNENAGLVAEIERLREASGRVEQPVQASASINITPVTSDRSLSSASRTNMEEPIYTMPSSPSLTAFHPANPNSTKLSQTATSHKITPNDNEGEERILPSGDREIRYPTGTTKLISKDKLYTRVSYYNGDVRESLRDGSVRYFYNESSSFHTTYPDGLEVVEFPSGQIERKNPNGVVEISYSNGCIKHIYPSGKEECLFPDRTVLRTDPSGDKVLLLANGQKEYQTRDYRKRLYPDGTVKIIYTDGSHETRFTNGRIRMKNAQGELIHDALHPLDS